MADLSNVTVEDGNVIGHVATNVINSECTFVVCTVEQWEEMDEDDAAQTLHEAAMQYVSIW